MIEWSPRRGFGISTAEPGAGYGEGPDEIYTDRAETSRRVIELFASRGRSVPPREVALRELRAVLGFTQEQLADRLGVQQAAVSRLDRRPDMTLSSLRRYVEALGGAVSRCGCLRRPVGCELHRRRRVRAFSGVALRPGRRRPDARMMPQMPKRWSLVVASLMLPVLMAHGDGCSCGSEGVELGPPTEATCPPTSGLTYANFGQAFMENYCTDCHSSTLSGDARNGAPAFHDFDTVEGIRSVGDHVDQMAGSGPAATNTGMPIDDPKPSMVERQQLSEWIACGAP
jgi:DNA-binding XRE family transcriptional regulator